MTDELRKAAQQALDELEDVANLLTQFNARDDSCIGASIRRANASANALRAALQDKAGEAVVAPSDADCLDWIERQHLEELGMGLVIDVPNDGLYYVCGDSGTTHYGKSLRDAIKGAITAQQKGGDS